jgi:uridylate kinase
VSRLITWVCSLELDCGVVLKATKVDGVYDKDPMQHTDAVKFDHVDFKEAVDNEQIKIMDKAAMALAMEHNLQLIIFDALADGNLRKVAAGETVGTTVS